jgi:hypothetical protein
MLLTLLASAAQQDHQRVTVFAKSDAVAGTGI